MDYGLSCLFRWRRNRSGVATAAASTATARTAHPSEASETLFLAGFEGSDPSPGPATVLPTWAPTTRPLSARE